MRKGVKAIWSAALAGAAFVPGAAWAQIADPKPGQGAPVEAPKTPPPAADSEVIVPDAEFEAALPKLSDDINAAVASTVNLVMRNKDKLNVSAIEEQA